MNPVSFTKNDIMDLRFAKKHSNKAAKEFMMLMLTKDYTIRPLSVNLDGYVPSVEVKGVLSLPNRRYNNSCQFQINKAVHCDDSKAVSWSKVLALDLANCNVSLSCDASFILDEEKKVIVCSSRWIDPDDEEDKDSAMNVIYVIGEDHQVTQVGFGIHSWAACWPAILSYVPSLAQINGAGGKRKRA